MIESDDTKIIDGREYISMFAASKLCSYSQEYLSLLARRGKIFAKKIGRNWYITRTGLDDYLHKQSIVISLPKQFAQQQFAGVLKSEKGRPVLIASIDEQSEQDENNSGVYEEFTRLNPHIRSDISAPRQIAVTSETPASVIDEKLSSVLEKLDTVSASVHAVTRTITEKTIQPVIVQPQSFGPNPRTNRRTRIGIWITAIVLLFLLVGGFSFIRTDAIIERIRQLFSDARTLGGHLPGTHANEVLVLDKAGNISIYGHVETQGQLRSYAPNGVAPIVVDSMTRVENLNAQYFDNLASKDFTLAFVTKNGNLTSEDVKLAGNVEVGKTLTIKGALKLRNALQVYGALGVFGDAVFGKNVTLTSGNLVLNQGTIQINNSTMVPNLNAQYLQGKTPDEIARGFGQGSPPASPPGSTLDDVVGNGNATSKLAFFNGGLYGGPGAFLSIGVAGDAAFGSVTNKSNTNFTVSANNFSVDKNGNIFGANLSNCGSTNKLQWSGGTFTCVTDQTGGGSGSALLRLKEFTTLGDLYSAKVSSISFDAGGFVLAAAGSSSNETLIRLDYANGPASRTIAQTITGLWTFNNSASISQNLEVGGYASLSQSVLIRDGTIGNQLKVTGSASFSGNVGIATTTPGYRLEVLDTIGRGFHVQSNVNGAALIKQINANGGSAAEMALFFGLSSDATELNQQLIEVSVRGGYNQAGTQARLWARNNGTGQPLPLTLGYGTAYTEVMRIATNGRVGIGTVSPDSMLHVASVSSVFDITSTGANASTSISFFPNGGASSSNDNVFTIRAGGLSGTAGERLDFLNGAATPAVLMTIASSGNVGIGTTSPQARLAVTGVGSGDARIGDPGCAGNYTGIWFNQGAANCTNYNVMSSPTDASLYINRPSGNSIQFRAGNSDQVTINSSGNVGIGTTNPASKLDVFGDANLSSGSYKIGSIPVLVASNSLNNIFVGQQAGNVRVAGMNNTTLGYNAGNALTGTGSTNGTQNVFIGSKAGQLVQTGANQIFIGYQAGGNAVTTSLSPNVGIGLLALNSVTSGFWNNAIGDHALFSNTTGDSNIAIGRTVMTVNTSGSSNIALGATTLNSNITGSSNVAVGNIGLNKIATGNLNSALGNNAGSNLATGSFNVFLGANSNTVANNASISYSTALGYNSLITNNHQLVVGGTTGNYFSEGFFGNGVSTSSPQTFRINATAGAGSNNTGGILRIAAGRGTGNANGGNLIFQVAPAGSSGSTANALVDRFTLWGSGGASLSTNFEVVGVASISGRLSLGSGASVSGNFDPAIDNTFDLGTTSLRWRKLQLGPGSLEITDTGGIAGAGTNYTKGKISFTNTASLSFGTAAVGSGSGGSLEFKTASSSRLYVTGGGNVGIGTTNPSALLTIGADQGTTANLLKLNVQVPSALPTYSANTDGAFFNYTAPSAQGFDRFLDIAVGTGNTQSNIRFLTSLNAATPVERMRIDNTGNIGIGATTPEQKLEVGGTILASASGNVDIVLRSLTTNGTLNNDDAKFILRTGSASERFDVINGAGTKLVSIASSGNVGIGTISPGGKLDVIASIGLSQFVGRFRTNDIRNNDVSFPLWIEHATTGTAANGIAVGLPFRVQTSGGTVRDAAYIYGGYLNATEGSIDSFLTFYTRANQGAPTERLRISHTGSIGVGTVSPDSILHVSSASSVFSITSTGTNASTSINFFPNGGASLSNQNAFTIRVGGTAGTGERLDFVNGATTPAVLMTIASSGFVGMGTITPAAVLDVVTTGPLWTTSNWQKAIQLTNGSVIKWAANAGGIRHGIGQSTNGLYFGRASGDGVPLTAITYNMFIGDDGGVGIDNITPKGSRLFILDTNNSVVTSSSFSIRANSQTVASIASISATSLAGGSILNITIPVSSSANNPHGLMLVKNTAGLTIASWSMGGALAIRGPLFSHNGGEAKCGGINNPTSGCIDYAETYPTTDQTLAAGDVIAVDPIRSANVKKADGTTTVLGIVSTNPAALIDDNTFKTGAMTAQHTPGTVPVALAGRVPVKISIENGDINAGDHLTISPTKPGYAMKATEPGMTIGVALEPSNIIASGSTQTILTFVNVGYWAPVGTATASGSASVTIASGSFDILGIISAATEIVVKKLRVTGDSIFEGMQKTYTAIATLDFGITNLAEKITAWNSRQVEITQTAPVDTKTLFQGASAQAADQSKVNLEDNNTSLATYSINSTRGEIQLTGSSNLIDGEAKIFFDFSFTSLISDTAPIKVIITPTSDTIRGQLYIATKNRYGFVVKELNGASNGTFDWLVIARKKGQEDAVLPSLTNTPEQTSISSGTPTPTPLPAVLWSPQPSPEASAGVATPSPSAIPSESPVTTVSPESTPVASETPLPPQLP